MCYSLQNKKTLSIKIDNVKILNISNLLQTINVVYVIFAYTSFKLQHKKKLLK